MNRFVDLHTHSTASDGQYTPGQLVEMAGNRKVDVLALTDHDTVDGVDEAEKTARDLGIMVVRGVELGAMEARNFHLLGYNFSEEAPKITDLCALKRKNKELRNRRMLDFLKSQGIELSLDDIAEIAGGANIGRPHFAQLMVKKGYVSTVREAFDRYLDTKEYDSIRVAQISARTCVETIKADGGFVSLAHPYQLGYDNDKLRDTVKQLKDWGLDAIECFYPKHTPEQAEFYLSLTREFGLHATGGSDFHGEKINPDIELARIELDLTWLRKTEI